MVEIFEIETATSKNRFTSSAVYIDRPAPKREVVELREEHTLLHRKIIHCKD